MKSLLSLNAAGNDAPQECQEPDHDNGEADDLTRLAASICDTPAALVCLQNGDRLSFGSRYGFSHCPTPGAFPFNLPPHHPAQITVVPDTTADARFRHYALVTCPPNVRFYAAAPLFTGTGQPLGSLCVMDYRPRHLPADKVAILARLARQMARQMALDLDLAEMQAKWQQQANRNRELMTEQEQLKAANARLAAENLRDPLTGIGNRRAFDRQLRLEMERSARTGGELSLALLDIDNFKTYNDHHGHPAGDGVLKQLAGLLAENMRIYDFAARLGGDEFALILPDVGESNARSAGGRFHQLVAAAEWPHRPVTASIGIATRGAGGGLTPQSLASHADQALYLAKHSGRNRLVLVSESPCPVRGVTTHIP